MTCMLNRNRMFILQVSSDLNLYSRGTLERDNASRSKETLFDARRLSKMCCSVLRERELPDRILLEP